MHQLRVIRVRDGIVLKYDRSIKGRQKEQFEELINGENERKKSRSVECCGAGRSKDYKR